MIPEQPNVLNLPFKFCPPPGAPMADAKKNPPPPRFIFLYPLDKYLVFHFVSAELEAYFL